MNVSKQVYSVLGVALLAAVPFKPAKAAAEPLLGEIMWVGFNFCPRGWAEANGQLLSIAQNSALFSLYGTTYGGDGRTTFALPDLRGRVAVHEGQGPGLSNRRQGQRAGSETETLNINQMPSHTHTVNASQGATTHQAAGSYPGSPGRTRIYDDVKNTTLSGDTLSNSGGSQAHNNMQPFLTLRACVALQGVYPSRN